MPTETKNNPISVRLPLPLRRSLTDHVERHDLVLSRFVRAAITEKLRRDRLAKRKPASVFPS